MATDKFYLKRHDKQPYYTARAIGSNSTILASSGAYSDATISATYGDTELYVMSTAGFPISGNLIVSDYISVSYTGKTPLKFTGCTWLNGNSGDTFKILNPVLEVINLTGAQLKFTMTATDGTIKVNRATANIVSAKLGDMEYRWQSVDVDTSGTYLAEFEITPTGSDKFTLPSNPVDRAIVVILDDLDNV